jgi:dihydrofolate synthase/folylpolyglutamate synthase
MLAASLRGLPRATRTLAVVGVLGDKDADGILRQLDDLIDQWVLCGLEGARGGTPEALRARLPADLPCVALAPDVAHGCATARALAGAEDRIVVFGSFHVVGPALDWLGI